MSGKFARTAAIALTGCLLAQPVAASTNVCTGQVLEVALNPTGGVFANVQGIGMRAYCDVTYGRTTNFGGGWNAPIPKEGCSTLYATLMAAKTTGRPVVLYFYVDIADCATNGGANDWFAVAPYWVVMSQ